MARHQVHYQRGWRTALMGPPITAKEMRSRVLTFLLVCLPLLGAAGLGLWLALSLPQASLWREIVKWITIFAGAFGGAALAAALLTPAQWRRHGGSAGQSKD